ncbi:MAG: hypothetical protein JKY09_07475 [Crocinitomicaceae bacterium]|nr:hypothetical protein [Crocinitomicaceae bacterium]
MKKKTNNSKAKGILQKYKATKTKGNIAGTGLKSMVDLVVGAALGAGIGASSGRAALPIGILLIAGSHYFDEDTGILRVAGSATIAYGIAKAVENKNVADAGSVNGFTLAGETSKAKIRLTNFKDELLTAFYLDKVFKKKEDSEDLIIETKEGIGAIDLSTLDVFEQNNKNVALEYGVENNELPEYTDESENLLVEEFDDESEDFSFAMIEEDPDLTNI